MSQEFFQTANTLLRYERSSPPRLRIHRVGGFFYEWVERQEESPGSRSGSKALALGRWMKFGIHFSQVITVPRQMCPFPPSRYVLAVLRQMCPFLYSKYVIVVLRQMCVFSMFQVLYFSPNSCDGCQPLPHCQPGAEKVGVFGAVLGSVPKEGGV